MARDGRNPQKDPRVAPSLAWDTLYLVALDVEKTPRKEPRQARSRATVDAILTATARVLVERGYDKASTNAIAERAGVSIGSLYQYFPNKEALVAALCEQHMAEASAKLMQEVITIRERPLAEAVRRIVKALLRIHASDPELQRVLIEQVPRLSGFARIQETDRMFVEAIRQGLEQRQERLRPKNLELAVFILVQSVQAITHAAVLEIPDALDDDELADEITDLVLRYLVDDEARHTLGSEP